MGFDLYSYDVPAAHQAPIVKRYFRCMHESGNLSPFDLSIATNLHTRANNSDWSKLVHIIERSVDGSILDAPVAHRCYKPDEDDYSLFTGDEFRPKVRQSLYDGLYFTLDNSSVSRTPPPGDTV